MKTKYNVDHDAAFHIIKSVSFCALNNKSVRKDPWSIPTHQEIRAGATRQLFPKVFFLTEDTFEGPQSKATWFFLIPDAF